MKNVTTSILWYKKMKSLKAHVNYKILPKINRTQELCFLTFCPSHQKYVYSSHESAIPRVLPYDSAPQKEQTATRNLNFPKK